MTQLAPKVNNLFGRKVFSWHFDLSPFSNPNLKSGLIFGGQVTIQKTPE